MGETSHHEALEQACADLPPSTDHIGLAGMMRSATGLDLDVAFVDGGWFRQAGLVDGLGHRVADDIDEWVIEETGGDMVELFNRYADADYYITRVNGRRVYLTAPTGPRPLDFVQVEVDEVQEVRGCRLFHSDDIPDSVADLLDCDPGRNATPLGSARYLFRRLTDFGVMKDLVSEHRGDPRLRRFAEEWKASSAGKEAPLCRRWALQVRPYRDPDGEHLLEAKPLPSFPVLHPLPNLQEPREHAVDYHPSRLVQDVDRHAGFPMAWYFLQLVRHYAPYRCMVDLERDFRSPPPGIPPLAPEDRQLVELWVDNPYNFF